MNYNLTQVRESLERLCSELNYRAELVFDGPDPSTEAEALWYLIDATTCDQMWDVLMNCEKHILFKKQFGTPDDERKAMAFFNALYRAQHAGFPLFDKLTKDIDLLWDAINDYSDGDWEGISE